jgi:hypothetical protein
MLKPPNPEQAAAAEAALRYVFPDLRFRREQITLDAAKFAFEVLRRVDLGARAAYGLFKLYEGTLVVTEWSDIPKAVYDAAKEASAHPDRPMKSRIALAFIAWTLQRLMQKHLDDPETFPCPDYSGLRSIPALSR